MKPDETRTPTVHFGKWAENDEDSGKALARNKVAVLG